ncbi:hypothetical protein V2J09_007964 [Rumex salicifolius]
MAISTKSWTKNLPSLAARIYFLLIVLQIPLFRVTCRAGMCTTPLHVTTSQLIASEIFPEAVIKGLLYPGAIAHGLARNMSIPTWDNLVNIYNLTDVKEAPTAVDLQRLEVLSGSYFCVAGALIGILKPGRMTMFGTLLVMWGLVKEGLLGKPVNTDPTTSVFIYPTMFLALVCAFASIKYDLKKMTQKAAPKPIAKPIMMDKTLYPAVYPQVRGLCFWACL